MKLNTIKPNKGSRTEKSRKGKGHASGLGKTSGRGHKGQKSRSGVAINGFEGGQNPLYMRLPKRGFNNPFQKKIQSINFHHIDLILNKYKIKPDEIKESVLFEKKIFNRSKGLLKLLDVGDLKSSINIEVSYASKNAIAKVEKNGGKVNLIKI